MNLNRNKHPVDLVTDEMLSKPIRFLTFTEANIIAEAFESNRSQELVDRMDKLNNQ